MAALSSSVASAMQQHEQQEQRGQREAGGGLEVLEADLAELENSVYHLVRSNVEIAQVRCLVKRREFITLSKQSFVVLCLLHNIPPHFLLYCILDVFFARPVLSSQASIHPARPPTTASPKMNHYS